MCRRLEFLGKYHWCEFEIRGEIVMNGKEHGVISEYYEQLSFLFDVLRTAREHCAILLLFKLQYSLYDYTVLSTSFTYR
jgi:hypothetical protein